MSLQPGAAAPIFTLPAKPGENVDVGQSIGRKPVVLLFFPMAFSPVCSDEMCHFRDHWEQWNLLDADIFGISVDNLFVTEKFRQELNIPFPVLSDFNKEVARQYDVLYDDPFGMKGIAKRSAYVIGADGTIKYVWFTDDPGVQVNFDEIRAEVESEEREGVSGQG
ncbi:MAG: peroxiredoxin [Phycisphaerales bacterium]|nr:MAG: peroxiredoxin [Phycisphaerales bacterium]